MGIRTFFASAAADGTVDLFTSDGTPGGTVPIAVPGAAAQGVTPGNLTVVGSTLLFTGLDSAGNTGLFAYNGTTGTAAEVSLPATRSGLQPGNLLVVGSKVVFAETSYGSNVGLLSYDPATGGVAAVGPGLTYRYPSNLTATGSTLLFSASDASFKTGLFSYDATSGTAAEVSVGGAYQYGLNPGNLTAAGPTVLFSGTDSAGHNSLFGYNTTTGSAAEISVGNSYGSGLYPSNFTVAGSTLLFDGTDASGNTGLFSYDTATGSAAEVSVGGANANLDPFDFTALGGQVLFVGNAASYGLGLFSYDPATNAATEVAALGSNPTSFTAVGSQVLFTTSNPSGGAVVLQSYGPGTGVTQVGASLGTNLSPVGFTLAGSHVLFEGTDAAGRFGLFSYNSTDGSVAEITPANAGPTGLEPTDLTSNGSVAAFYGEDGTGTGVWVSDGTAAGTVEVLSPGQAQPDLSVAYAAPGFGVVPPSIAITSAPVAGRTATQVITGTLTAGGFATAAGQAVTLTDNGAALSTASPVVTDAHGGFSATVVLPYQGANSLVASSQDSTGAAARSAAVVDTLDSTAPTVTLAAPAPATPAANPSLDPYGTETIAGTVASGGAASVAGQVVTLSANGTALATASPVLTDAQGAFSATVNLPGPGAVGIVATTQDSYGNGGSSAAVSVGGHLDALLFGTATTTAGSAAGQVYGLYEGILGRAPDAVGYENALGMLGAGTPLAGLAQAILGSAEYTADYGAAAQRSPTAFVTTLYQDALGRSPDAAGLQSWTAALANGATQAQVATGIALSPEAINDLQPTFLAPGGVFAPSGTDDSIARLYYGLLGRAPDAGGLQTFEGLVAGGASLTDVANDVLNSQEYQAASGGLSNAQFVQALYADALGRTPDAGGAQLWNGELDGGAARTAVALGIVESTEAQTYLAASVEFGFKLA